MPTELMETPKQAEPKQPSVSFFKDEHDKQWVAKVLHNDDAKLELLGYKLLSKFQIVVP
jgi:hypothetical protein